MAATPRRDDAFASPREAAAALAALSDADLLRLERFCRVRAAGLQPLEWRDLLQDAVDRMLAGSRRWPKDVALTAFVRMTVRSLANDQWRRRLEGPEVAGDEVSQAVAMRATNSAPDAERALAARQLLAAILSHFASDPDVLAVIAGLEAEETAAQTQARTRLSLQQYGAARKRLSRGLDRLFVSKE